MSVRIYISAWTYKYKLLLVYILAKFHKFSIRKLWQRFSENVTQYFKLVQFFVGDWPTNLAHTYSKHTSSETRQNNLNFLITYWLCHQGFRIGTKPG